MTLPAKPTLGEMRAELMARLGFASQGASTGNYTVSANSYLRRAQEHVYWKYELEELRLVYGWTTGVGQTLYDWQSNMEPRQIIQIRVYVTNQWIPLTEGIDFQHDSFVDNRYYPQRYDRRAQLEIWPEPDVQYPMRTEHYQRLGRFTEDGDRCTIDDYLVATLALANAKAHLRHPDAQLYLDEFNDIIKKLKKRNFGNKRYIVGETARDDIQPKPRTVDYL